MHERPQTIEVKKILGVPQDYNFQDQFSCVRVSDE